MAQRHGELLAVGTRPYGISIDSPQQNAAMIEKLRLPFPLLSDPDRAAVIESYGVADPKDPRSLARPALVLIAPDREEAWRFVSRDFAERLPEDEVVGRAAQLGLPATTQPDPTAGQPEPGPRAMPIDQLHSYFRGARFAALAMGLRHGHHDDSITEDSKAYVAEMDRYMDAVKTLTAQSG